MKIIVSATRSKGKTVLQRLATIEYMVDELNKKLGNGFAFDNSVPNKYKIFYLGTEFTFETYGQVINSLKLVLRVENILIDYDKLNEKIVQYLNTYVL